MTPVRKEPRIVSATEVNVQDLPVCAQSQTEEGTVLKASSISLDSGSYKVEDILVMRKAEQPIFARVAEIYATTQRVALVLEMLRVQEFCSHAHSFKVAKTHLFELSEPGREASWQRLDMYLGTYVSPRCEVLF